jgi:hypothetical protein
MYKKMKYGISLLMIVVCMCGCGESFKSSAEYVVGKNTVLVSTDSMGVNVSDDAGSFIVSMDSSKVTGSFIDDEAYEYFTKVAENYYSDDWSTEIMECIYFEFEDVDGSKNDCLLNIRDTDIEILLEGNSQEELEKAVGYLSISEVGES